jgi:hypothetical protein
MAREDHPFHKLIDDIVASGGNPQALVDERAETMLANAKETVLQSNGYRGEPFEQLAHGMIRDLLGEKNPNVRVQLVAQVLATVAGVR